MSGLAEVLEETAPETTYLLYIGGRWVEPSSGKYFEDRNPARGDVFAYIAQGDREDARRAIEAAAAAQPSWSQTAPSRREEILLGLAGELIREKDRLAGILMAESGSSYFKAVDEVNRTVNLVRGAAADCRHPIGESLATDAAKWSITRRKPVGVIGAITPWNFPLFLTAKKIALGLASGNTLVVKPASEAPAPAFWLAELLHRAGLPAGVLNVVSGPGSTVGDELAVHPATRMVSLTGSAETGKQVAARAAGMFKRISLELGGKNPLIILRDADPDYAARAVVFGAFQHQGQNCMSVERIIVERPLLEEVAGRVAQAAEALKVGDPDQHDNLLGPMINEAQRDIVHRHVRDAVEQGARLLAGGTYEGLYYRPTVLTGITRSMDIFRQETFGPVAPFIAVEDAEEALEVANDSHYGLSSGIITNDLSRAVHLAEHIESGMVHINDCSLYSEIQVPFGGVKDSGFGREGSGGYALEEMTELKWITIQQGKRAYPF